MKSYVITEADNECDEMRVSGVSIAMAFPSREKAQAECASLNGEDHTDSAKATYSVAEVELSDDPEANRLAFEQARTAKARAKEALRTYFLQGCHTLFQSHPGLRSFSWGQYYPCQCSWGSDSVDVGPFSVDYHPPKINGVRGHEADNGCGFDPATEKYAQLREPSLESKLQQPVKKFLSTFDDNDLQEMFGEEVTVTAHRDGTIETDDCDVDEL